MDTFCFVYPIEDYSAGYRTHLSYEVLLGPNNYEVDGDYVLKLSNGEYGVYSGSPRNGWFGGERFKMRREAFHRYFTNWMERNRHVKENHS